MIVIIKRLALPTNIILSNKRIIPTIHKEGLYINRLSKISWVEVLVNGYIQAHLYNYNQAINTLNTLNASELNINQVNALISIVTQKLATKHQRNLLYYYQHHIKLKNVSRDNRTIKKQLIRRLGK